ncbi:MAG: response regulator transcription factor [Chitinophagaceae bacterium]
MNSIKVAIAEDHRIFRKGIILSMQPYHHINFVIEAGNGKELIEQLHDGMLPEVVLMDLRMPGMDGIEATKYMVKHYPKVHIICLTMFEDQQFVKEMMESGACGYLLKNAEPREISTAIGEVVSKGYYNSTCSNGILFNKS